MAENFVNVGDNGAYVGRADNRPNDLGNVYFTYKALFSATQTYTFDFNTINTGAQQNVFGLPSMVFIDNSLNPAEVVVIVEGTQQRFTAPPFSEGYYKLDARLSSKVQFTSTGPATGAVTLTIYNYEFPASVWYKFGTLNTDLPLKAQGANANGTAQLTNTNNYPLLMGGVDPTGNIHWLALDASGNIQASLSGSIAVTVANGADVTQGAIADAAYSDTTGATSGTVVALLKGAFVLLAARFTTLVGKFTAGPLTDAGSLSVVPSAGQNPIFDHANGTKTAVTTSAAIITPPALCQYVRISSDVNIYVNTNNVAAVDDGTSILVSAGITEIIPVVAGIQVRALSSAGSATVRCTPLKVR